MTVTLDKTGVPARPSTPDVALPDVSPRMVGRRRRPGPQGLRTAVCIIAMALTAGLALAACGGRHSGLAVASQGSTRRGPAGVEFVGFVGFELLGISRPAGARVRAVHAASRRDGLPRPQQQRELPSQRKTNLVERPSPVPGGPYGLQRPAPERRQRADPGPVATDPEHHGGVRPLHAPPWSAGLARPHLRYPRAPCFQYKRRPEFATVHWRDPRMYTPAGQLRQPARVARLVQLL